MFQSYIKFILLFFLLFLSVSHICASEEKIAVKADYLRYDKNSTLMNASGNVEVSSPIFLISSDSLSIDPSGNHFIFDGHVNGTMEGNTFSSNKFVLFADDEYSIANNIEAKLRSKDVGGIVTFKADTLHRHPEKNWGESGDFTTCKYPGSHYRVHANSFEYYPKSRIEAHDLVFSVGPVPVMYSPYWFYRLGYQNPILSYPVIGQDEKNGWFVQTTWDYFWNKSNRSLVLLDWYEKVGYGVGVDQRWSINDSTNLSAKLFGIIDTSGVLKGESKFYTDVKYDTKLSPYLTTNAGYYFQNYDRNSNDYSKKEQKKMNFSIKYAKDKEKYGFSFDHFYDKRTNAYFRNNIAININEFGYDESKNWDKYHESISRKYSFNNEFLGGSQSLYHTIDEQDRKVNRSTISERYNKSFYFSNSPLTMVSLSLSPELIQSRANNSLFDKSLKHNYTTKLGFDSRSPVNSVDINYNWVDDMDGETVTSDYYDKYNVKSLPVVNVALKNATLDVPNPVGNGWINIFQVQNSFLFGHYIERRKLRTSDYKMDTNKYSIKLALSRSIPIEQLGSTFFFRSNLEQNFYGTGDQSNYRSDTFGVDNNWFNCINYSLTFNKNYPGIDMFDKTEHSNSPFFFDAQAHQKSFSRSQALTFYLMSPKEELPARYSELTPVQPQWKMLNWMFSWNHNFINKNPVDVHTVLTLKPLNTLTIDMDTYFAIERKRSQKFWSQQPLITNVLWNISKELYLKQSFRHDLNLPARKNLLSASTELGYVHQVGESEYWKFTWNTIWDAPNKQWKTNSYSVMWELDCLQYMYDYQRQNEEHKFTFKVKAFEADPVGFTKSKVNKVEKWQIQGLDKSMEQR
ncbi:MAG TPA: hypothetical protein DF296_06695 [Candidatus Margulisbacteria bacterium]|nr:MAG: hypothetical protein A2X41_02300 [Candidatus Margulisbacteria bacterium GWE2_39_32]HCT84872.1 hypothetical protein [Candidatus Margulisiibacteriota bacterium]